MGGNNENVLAVFAEHGLIAQDLYFATVASNDTSGYCVVAPGQFVYNKSTLSGFGMG